MWRRMLTTWYVLVLTGTVMYLGVWAVRVNYELEAIDHDYEQMAAIRESQLYARPIIRLANQLAEENAMFTTVIDRAREHVQAKDTELAAARNALQQSVASLLEQAEDLHRVGEELKDAHRLIRMKEAAIERLEQDLQRARKRIEELEVAPPVNAV